MKKAYTLFLLLLWFTSFKNNANAQWEAQDLGFNGHLISVDFWDKNIGFVVGLSGAGALTKDGGDTWIKVDFPFDENLHHVKFASENDIWVLSGSCNVYRSEDQGVSWKQTKMNCPESLKGLRDIKFSDNNIIIVGLSGFAYKSTDGGESWEEIKELKNPDNNYMDFCFKDDLEGFLLGAHGLIKKTIDGGASWLDVDLSSVAGSSHLYDMFFQTPDIGWLVGSQGLVLKTKDGGLTWEKVNVNYNGFIKSIIFLDAKKGWMSGGVGIDQSNMMLKWTANGGDTWHNGYIPSNNQKGTISELKVLGNQVWGVGTQNLVMTHTTTILSNNEIPKERKVKLFPNPVENTAIIELPVEADLEKISLYDTYGRKIAKTHFKESSKKTLLFEKKNLQSGMYVLFYEYNNTRVSTTLLIK